MKQTTPRKPTSAVETVLTRSAEEAAAIIRKGGLVAFPTETVYGLGADVFNTAALKRIFDAKGRPSDNPLISHVSGIDQILKLAETVPVSAEKLIDRFFPGPLTVVLKKRAEVPLEATAGLGTIGVRMPADPLAHEFLLSCSVPVAAPSANLSGRPSPTTWAAVLEDLSGRIDGILMGDQTAIGLESTVVDCSGPIPYLLRRGSVSEDDIRTVLPDLEVGTGELTARSPGLKHRHYSPRAAVKVVRSPSEAISPETSGYIGLEAPKTAFALVRVCRDAIEYAHALFEFFRECDRQGLTPIYCQEVGPAGVGAALMDRVDRASRG